MSWGKWLKASRKKPCASWANPGSRSCLTKSFVCSDYSVSFHLCCNQIFMHLDRTKDLPTVESWTQVSVVRKIYWHSKTHTLNFKQTKTFEISRVLHAGAVGGQAQVPFQAPYKDVQSNSNCESLASLCSDIWIYLGHFGASSILYLLSLSCLRLLRRLVSYRSSVPSAHKRCRRG